MMAKSLFSLHAQKEKDLGHYWKNAAAFLTLEVANELLQSFRVQDQIVEPLLITLSVVVRNQKEFAPDLVTDLSKTLLDLIQKDSSAATFQHAFQACSLLFPQNPNLKQELARACQPSVEQAKELVPDQLCGNCTESTGLLLHKLNTILAFSNFRRFFNVRVLEETVQWATSKLSQATLKAVPKNR